MRRAAIAPAVASGHPRALAQLDALAAVADPGVAGAAAGAGERLRRAPLSLRFSVLGGFVVRRAAWTVDEASWHRPLAARVVRFLLVHRESPVPEDLVFEAFWPGKPPDAARRNLAVAVSHARRALDVPGAQESVIVTGERTYALRLHPADRVDADDFDAAALAALRADPAAARPLLERAAALWTGDPLPEERYADWTFAWRERLLDRYRQILGALGALAAERGDHDEAIRVGRKRVELDALDEGAQRDLVVAFARAGRRSHALRQLRACRRALVDELGVEPSSATIELQNRVLAGAPV
jgi:DNA-binding SARP family transcriptional activator